MVSDIEIRLRADIARLQQDMDKARQAVGGSLDKINAAVGKTIGVFGGLAVAAGGAAFVGFIKNSIDAADALNDLSKQTKIATEDLAGLQLATKLSGTSLEATASAINKLGVNIGKDAEKFRALGVSASDPVEAFKQLAEVFKNIENPQQRAAFGAAVLGKSWAEVAPLLDEGAVGIGKLIERGKALSGVTDAMVQDAAAFNDKLDEIGIAVQGTGTRIAADLLPLLNQLVDDLTATGTSATTAANGFSPLAETIRALVILFGNVAFTFKAVGTEIGVLVAQVGAFNDAVGRFLVLDWEGGLSKIRQALHMGEAAKADAALAREGFDQWEQGWLNVGKAGAAAAKEVGGSAEDMLAALASAGAKAEAAAKASAFLKAEEMAAARKKAAGEAEAATRKEHAAYLGLITVLREKQAINAQEISTGVQLTEGQKALVKFDEEIKSGKLVLNKAHRDEVRALLEAVEAQEAYKTAAKNTAAAVQDLADDRKAAVASAVSEAEAQERLAKEFGLSKKAILALALARDEERLAQRASLDLDEKEVQHLEQVIAARKRAAAAAGSVEALEQQKKATEQATDANLKMWESIDRTAHDTFVSILDGGKDVATRLKDALKNGFFDWLYQQTLKKWIINIQTNAGAGGGGLLSSLGSLFGSSPGATNVKPSSTPAVGAGAGAVGGGFMAVAGWIAAGMALADGLMKKGFDPGNGSVNTAATNPLIPGAMHNFKILQGLGLDARTSNMISGASVVTALFGRKSPEITSQGLQGSVGAGGFSGQAFAEILQKGGLFRSDKRYTQTSGLATDQQSFFDKTITGMVASVKGFAAVLGAEASVIDGYNKQIKLVLTKDDAENQKLIAEMFGGIGDDLATLLVPSLSALAAEGESASTTLQRVATNYAGLDAVLSALGDSFGAVGVSSLTARERFISLSGGIETLAANAQVYADNFMTDAERLAPVQKQVTEGMAALGLAGISTREQFKAFATALDLTDEAQAATYAGMMKLAGVFAQVTPAIYDNAEALRSAAEQRASIQKELDQLGLTQAQKERSEIDATNLSLYDLLQTRKAERDAIAETRQAALTERTRMEGGLRDAISTAFDQVQTLVNDQKAAEKDAFQDVMTGIDTSIGRVNTKVARLRDLASALAAVGPASQTPQQQAASRQVAQAQILAALAIAKSSGILPSADSLKFALANVGSEDTGQFATLEEFQRSQRTATNGIAELSRLTGVQLTIEERNLIVLQELKSATQRAYDAQVSSLDGILTAARKQMEEALKGNKLLEQNRDAVLTIPAALASLGSAISTWQRATAPAPTGAAATPNSLIEHLYQTLFGRAGDAAGVAFWTNAMQQGMDIEKIKAEFLLSPEYLAYQTAQTVQKTEVAPTAQTSTMSQGNTEALLAELQTLNVQMAQVKADTAKTANNTGQGAQASTQMAQQFDNVTAGGNVLLTEAVNP